MKNDNPAARTQHQRPNRPAAAVPAGKCSAAGRSMIEMLGVLSIVGILSVGGIYHLGRILTEHRQIRIAEEYAWLVQNVVADFNALRLPKDQRNISSDIAKSPLMPAGWKYKAGYLQNDMGQVLFLQDNGSRKLQINFEMGKKQGMTYNQKGLCRILFNNVLRPLASEIYMAANYWGNDYVQHFYGTNYCNNGNLKCLSRISVEEIEKQCALCLGEKGEYRTNCAVVMFFKI